MTIEEVLAFDEMQIFDRKSINIDPKALSVTLRSEERRVGKE